MSDIKYVVVISGYEGIDEILGPFNARDALVVHNELKQDCVREWDVTYDYVPPDWLWSLYYANMPPGYRDYVDAHSYYFSIRDHIAETRYGLCDLPEQPDRVCIMKGTEPGSRMACCCQDFPTRIPNTKSWLR